MVEMSVQNGVEQIREIEKRCEESAIKRVEENTREKRAMRRAMGMDAVQHELVFFGTSAPSARLEGTSNSRSET